MSASDNDLMSFVPACTITNGTATNSGCVSIRLVRRRTLKGCTGVYLIPSTYLAMESDMISTLRPSKRRKYVYYKSLNMPSKILN